MIKDNGDAVKFAKNNNGAFNATGRPKDATIAGGIALRAMAKGSNVNDSTDDQEIIATEIKEITVSAATKSSDTLTIAIRKTINGGPKTVKEDIKINANDTPISPDQITPKFTVSN